MCMVALVCSLLSQGAEKCAWVASVDEQQKRVKRDRAAAAARDNAALLLHMRSPDYQPGACCIPLSPSFLRLWACMLMCASVALTCATVRMCVCATGRCVYVCVPPHR